MIYKMSKLYGQEGLYTKRRSYPRVGGNRDVKEMKQGGVYRNREHRIESEEIKLCEIITISGNRVGAGKVLMLVINVTQLVFGLGLVGVICSRWEDGKAATTCLSSRARNWVHLTLSHSFSDMTVTSYACSVRKFTTFCSRKHIPWKRCWPADESAFCASATSFEWKMAGDTVRNHLASLKAWHGSPQLLLVVRRVANLAPCLSRNSTRPVVTW